MPILQNLSESWDAIDSAWNEWVLGYGPDQQIALLRNLGVGNPDWRWLVAAMAATLAALLTGLAGWLAWRYQPPRLDEVQRLYKSFLDRLHRSGLRREPWEGPVDFCHRAVRLRPAHEGAIRRITTSYVHLRYGPAHCEAELDRMRKLLRSFRP
jgi:hypothetical protein